MALAALGTAGCGSDLFVSSPPPVRYEDVVATGWLASFDGVSPGTERPCADETRFSIELAAGAEIDLPLELGEAPELTLAACRPGEGGTSSALRIEVRGRSGLASELELPVDGAGWNERRLDLAAYADHPIDLRISAASTEPLLVSDLYLRHRSARVRPRRGELSGPGGRPPVLLISVDTLRADAIGPETTPALAAFADRAETWSPHYSAASWTKPSHASLLTGYPPEVHGAELEPSPIRSGVPTLAERFSAAGYRTAGLVYDCAWLDPKWGFGRGFSEYRVMPWTAGDEVRASLDWMVEHRSEPFFYFLHLYTAHSDDAVLPYEGTGVDRGAVEERFGAPDYGCREGSCASRLLHGLNDGLAPLPNEAEILRFLYARGVATADTALGALFRDLEDSGLFDRMMIVVTADHGEAFFDHGQVLHSSLHREIVQVPLLVKWPAGSGRDDRAGTIRRQPSASIDVAPTLLEAAGIDGSDLPGSPLEARSAVTPIFTGTISKAIITRRVEAIFKAASPDGTHPESVELYDLESDPGQQTELSAKRPEEVARLRRGLEEHLAAAGRLAARLQASGGRDGEGGDGRVELTPEERRRLEGLGYLGGGGDSSGPPERH